MSTQSFLHRRGRGLLQLPFALLVGVLLALQGVVPSVALARSQEQTTGLSASLTQIRDETGVAVVRLVMSYSDRSTNAPIECTGLGTLIASSPSPGLGTHTYQSWVITDASLLNASLSSCAKAMPIGGLPLTSIEILASNEYTNTNQRLASLGQLSCVAQNSAASCKDSLSPQVPEAFSASPQGYTLFSFQSSAWQPYLTLNFGSAPSPISLVKLTDTAGDIFPQIRVGNSLTTPFNYLTPETLPLVASGGSGTLSSSVEGGTPQVDNAGNLIGMYLNSGSLLNISSLQAALHNVPFSSTTAPNTSDPLKTNWDQGIRAYYSQDYRTADTAFRKILALHSTSFVAAQNFDKLAIQHISVTQHAFFMYPPVSVSIILVLGLIALIALVVAAALFITRARRRQIELQRFATEQAEAQRFAEDEAQHQRVQHLQPPAFTCPNCHQAVHLTDGMCPYCRFPLSPSASGLNIQLAGTNPMAPNPIAPPPPPISEQPTWQFLPNNASPQAAEDEKTGIYTRPESIYHIQQASGYNLSLAVGTLSDPGIKRKHKPNEDSLFAMQGSRTHNSQPQQFGLFVVADGMGGHAQGQDASRLAIQTMIDFMLPRISSSEPMDDDAFQNLLSSGVQHANQAVHAHNVEIHADMGTTMTAALVVGATAYVANVGDSRTYLYREGQGLQKVTNDHSVVASLVLAGIIQPDDIYTHPKRNQIYRSLGEKPVVEVDIFKVALLPGDKLLLCSDGLWDMVRDPLIQEVLSKPTGDPNRIGKDLIKAALEGGGEDNVTVIVAQFGEMNEKTGLTGVQLLAKPETVTIPNLPLQQ